MRRVLLKLSGEAFSEQHHLVFSKNACEGLGKSILEIAQSGVQIGIVVGGGNIFRGQLAKEFGMKQTPADHIGMLATAINGIVLAQVLENVGLKTRIMSALDLDNMIEPYHWKSAMHALENGEIVIFVGGTGNPYFTTDTGAALRAIEIEAEYLLKATKVDGVYDKDPLKFPDAKRYENLTYEEALEKNLKIMDAAAIALCRENAMQIYVFNLFAEGALKKAVLQRKGGTLVTGGHHERPR